MNANPILLQKKYARVVELFAKENAITVAKALDIFNYLQENTRDKLSINKINWFDYLHIIQNPLIEQFIS